MGSAVYGVTQFADLTAQEFRQHYTGLRPELQSHDSKYMRQITDEEIRFTDLPQNFDWRNASGVVSDVKNQGMCGQSNYCQ